MSSTKLFDLKNGALLLLTKEYDASQQDGDKVQIVYHIAIPTAGYKRAVILGYPTVELRDGVFDAFTLKDAQDLFDKVPKK